MNATDHFIDGASTNPGKQTFEKMVSGMYLGEICRVTLAGPKVASALSPEFKLAAKTALSTPSSFSTAAMAACEEDTTPELEQDREIAPRSRRDRAACSLVTCRL